MKSAPPQNYIRWRIVIESNRFVIGLRLTNLSLGLNLAAFNQWFVRVYNPDKLHITTALSNDWSLRHCTDLLINTNSPIDHRSLHAHTHTHVRTVIRVADIQAPSSNLLYRFSLGAADVGGQSRGTFQPGLLAWTDAYVRWKKGGGSKKSYRSKQLLRLWLRAIALYISTSRFSFTCRLRL